MFDLQTAITYLKKQFTKRDLLYIVGILALFAATRLINLDKFPIFSDEGIYIHWAKTAWHDATWRFISLTDGKQPLQTWGTIPFLKLFPNNALLGGRLFAVTMGLFGLTGMFSLLFYLFGKRAALIGSLIFVLNPYFIFYDRLALVDSGVNAFFIWILLFSIILVRTVRLDVALIMGMIAGFGLLAKSSVQIFLGLSAFAPVLFTEKNKKHLIKNTINYYFLYAIVAVLAILIYNVQRLSPFLHYVAEKNTTFVMTFDEFLQSPFSVFQRNILLVPQYVSWEAGFFFSLLALAGLFVMFKKNLRLAIYLFLWLFIPYIMIAFFSKVLFPRYTIFFGSLLVILATYLIYTQKKIQMVSFILILYIISITFADYTIIADFKNIPLPPIDRGQYIEGWPAGWGAKEIVDYAREKSAEKPVIILAEGNFGMSGDVLDVFLRKDDRISIRGYWPLGEKELLENQKDLGENYVYVVLSHAFDYPKEWPMRLIKRFEKPNNKSVMYLFELTQ